MHGVVRAVCLEAVTLPKSSIVSCPSAVVSVAESLLAAATGVVARHSITSAESLPSPLPVTTIWAGTGRAFAPHGHEVASSR